MKKIIKLLYEDFREGIGTPFNARFICCHALVKGVHTSEAQNVRSLLMRFVDDFNKYTPKDSFRSTNNLSDFPEGMDTNEADAYNLQSRADLLCLLSKMNNKELKELLNC